MTELEEQTEFDVVEKEWPMSVGDGKAQRKKRPRILAITTDCCTGCAGSPACIEYCPIEACMFWVSDEDHPPFGQPLRRMRRQIVWPEVGLDFNNPADALRAARRVNQGFSKKFLGDHDRVSIVE